MATSDYESVRNMTLLFFFERIIAKGEPQSLHDLSCQFGAKGFTKEMRQIAGGSQAGLRNFLSRYPALFIIDGDMVDIQTFAEPKNRSANISANERHAKQAVEYFTTKLRQYGEGTRVPLKTLFGHRSQASPEVRYICGHRITEFREFLGTYRNDFILSEHSVMLKQFEGRQQQPLQEQDSNNQLKTVVHDTRNDESLSAVSLNRDNWNTTILQNTKLIENVQQCLHVVEQILSNEEETAISFRCKSVKAQLTLFQIGLKSGEVYIFDLLSCPNLVVTGGLQKLLESEKVVKVIHDCKVDSANLFNIYGVTLRNVFDTQVAHAVVQSQLTGEPVHKVKNVSSYVLYELYGCLTNTAKETLNAANRTNDRYWTQRPIKTDMLLHAAAEVSSLVPNVYCAMLKQLRKDSEPLLMELCAEQVLMFIKPNEAKLQNKERKLESQLSEIREKLATDANATGNIVLSNREIRLLRYLDLTEDEREKLKSSRKVARQMEKWESKAREEENAMFTSQSSTGGKLNSSDNSLSGEPPTVTDCTQLMDELLLDTGTQILDEMERFDALLTSAITSDNDDVGD